MLYKDHFIRHLLLPPLPDFILEKINWNLSEYKRKAPVVNNPDYMWSDDFNNDMNDWCQKNIAGGIYYAFQFASRDMPVHKDHVSTAKLLYILDAGGDDVYTEFYKEDSLTLLHKEKLPLHQWYVVKTDINHAVKGITPPRIRFSICASLFGKI